MNQAITLKLPGVEQGLRYGVAYWSGTVGNLLTTNRLKATRARRYVAQVDISDRLLGRWHRLFDVPPGCAGEVPFLYNQSVGTLLYTRIFADLGINFRHLLHVQHETAHMAGVSACAAARRQRLDCGLKRLSRIGDGKALVDLETRIHSPDNTLLAVVRDRFLIRKLPSHDLANLGSDQAVTREMQALRARTPELVPHAEGTHGCSIKIAHDMGRSYGKVSGDMNPVHTTRLGARLFGLPRPFLQGLGVRNLAIRHMAGLGVPLDHLSLTFVSPAYLGQALSLLVRDGCFELQDERRRIVAYGVSGASVTPAAEQ